MQLNTNKIFSVAVLSLFFSSFSYALPIPFVCPSEVQLSQTMMQDDLLNVANIGTMRLTPYNKGQNYNFTGSRFVVVYISRGTVNCGYVLLSGNNVFLNTTSFSNWGKMGDRWKGASNFSGCGEGYGNATREECTFGRNEK